MIASSDIIASIADDLNRLQEHKRAKKLVFYISQRYWESDYSVIDGYSFESLLHTLYQSNPTLDDLKALLYQAVNTLNRKTVYTKIAQYIFKRMSPLYDAIEDEDQSQGNELETAIIDRISENIEYHEESPRIKKLIFAACKQYWENDSSVIEMYDLKELLGELYELYPNQKRLKRTLDKIVSSINRKNFYSFIADTIIGEMNYLYKHEVREIKQEEEDTELIRAKKKNKPAENKTEDTSDSFSFGDDSGDQNKSIGSRKNPEDTLSIKQATDVIPSSVPEGQILPWLKVDSLFELKQEIMQYTNPLRAKIMLFYMIYQIDPYEQHWSIVRTCSLDDLLIKLFQQYGKDIDTIKAKLLEIANVQIEGLESEDNIQASNALTECLKHFYKK